MKRLVFATLLGTAASGCFSASLDPDLDGVFACEGDEDCPDGRICANALCTDEASLPTLEVRNPENEEARDITAFPDTPTVPFNITISGTLDLVSVSSTGDHVPGEGHVAVIIDGDEQAIVDSGGLSGGVGVEIELDRIAGPHRIALQARRNDGLDYDNPGATATRLFWLNDGEPAVAIADPWPGTTFDLEPQMIDIKISTINFGVEGPQPEGTREQGRGHVHIYYDEVLEDCVLDPDCDANYFSVVNETFSEGTIPSDSERAANIGAMLRNLDHSPYKVPFESEDGRLITDQVTVNRVDG